MFCRESKSLCLWFPFHTHPNYCWAMATTTLEGECGSLSHFQISSFNPSTEFTPSNRVTRQLPPSLALLPWLCHWALQPDILTQTTAKAHVLPMAPCYSLSLGHTACAFEQAFPAWLLLTSIYQTGGKNHHDSLVLPQELQLPSLACCSSLSIPPLPFKMVSQQL